MCSEQVNEESRSAHIIVLSGPTGVGKTTLAQELVSSLDALHLSTSSLIASRRPSQYLARSSLQQAGNALDQETDFRWIADEVSKLERVYPGRSFVIDAVRKPEQLLALRKQTTAKVTHLHLEASYDHLVHRHHLRSRDIDRGQRYEVVAKDASESYYSDLESAADLRLDTEKLSPPQLAERVIIFLDHAGTHIARF